MYTGKGGRRSAPARKRTRDLSREPLYHRTRISYTADYPVWKKKKGKLLKFGL